MQIKQLKTLIHKTIAVHTSIIFIVSCAASLSLLDLAFDFCMSSLFLRKRNDYIQLMVDAYENQVTSVEFSVLIHN